jgi:two-component system response regulator YesN
MISINEAKRLLKNTPMTVQNVATNVGYTDIRAFNRLFKKYTNQTPNEYRASE